MATTTILPPTQLHSGRASLLRGTYDRSPIQIAVIDPERLLCPISVRAGDETILTLHREDARLLADALLKAARTAGKGGF